MADLERNMKIKVETGAAQEAVGKLADTMTGLAKANDDGGDAMKRATREVAEATAKMNAAREAAQKEQRALNEATAAAAAHGKESAEAAAALGRLKAAQEASAKAAKEADDALAKAATSVNELAGSADKKALPAVKRLANEIQKVNKEADRNSSELRTLEHRITSLGGAAKGSGAMLASFFGNLGANAVSSLAGRIGELGMHALSTAASFESMKTSLASTLGSTEEANKKFAELQQFAAATPFSLEEATQGFLKLKNLGLDASTRAMTAYGDMAGATGKTMMDVVEAVADAAQGEGERLKEFGIRMSKDGDKIRLTFRGMTQEMKFDSKEIEQYLIRLGETNFAGGMLAQSKTLGGLWSSMKDGFDQFIVSIMDSGITDALKSLMGTFSGMGETGKFLSDLLGLTLGAAFTGLAGTVKVAAGALELFFTAANAILSPVYMAKDAIESLARDSMTSIVAETEKLIERQKELDAAYWESAKGTGTLASDMKGLIDLSGQYALSIAAEGLAHLEAANAADRRMKSEADLWKKLEERNAKAEQKAVEDAFFAANEMGPQLPPGFKKDKKKGKKKADLSGQGMEAAKRYEMETRREREQAFAANVALYEKESDLQDGKIRGIEREIEAINARGVAEAEQVDAIFFTLSVESEAAAQREALIDQRIAAEERLARWQVKNAKTANQREKAQTRLEAAEHTKRLRNLEKIARVEEKEYQRKEKAVSSLVGAVTTLGEGMVGAFERMAAGEKGAMASMLKELLAGVAKKHAILALGEAASAIGAFASYRYVAAAQHGTAAAMHTAVALTAGAGAMTAGAIADARQHGGGGRNSSGAGFNTTGAGRPGGGSAGGGSSRELEPMETPVSYEDSRRRDTGTRSSSGGGGVVINIHGSVLGDGGPKKLAQEVDRIMYTHRGAGKRA